MSRLPIPGADQGTWGDILNDFLSQSLNPDGTLKPTSVAAASPVTSVAGKTGAITLTEADISNLTSDLASKAADSTVVHNTGNESIAGVKTFTSAPIVPSNSFPESAITSLTSDLAAKVPTSRQIISGTGLSGGGDLTTDRTLSVNYGTTAGTAAQGNDSRITGALQSGTIAGGDLTGTYPNPTFDLTKTHTWTANQTAPALISSGLTGATAASRYVGATASGAPSSGTFAVGDFVMDQTGKMWVCTGAGTPGTWVGSGFAPSGTLAAGTHIVGTSGSAYSWAPGMLNACTFSGVDPTGATSSTAGMLAAIQASINPGGNGGQGLYVPAGTYKFDTTLDLTTITGITSTISNWQWVCDSGAIFQAGSGLGANTLLKLSPPAGKQFNQCRVVLGQLLGAAVTGQTGVYLNNFSDGIFEAMQVHSFNNIGIEVDCIGQTFPCANNIIRFPLVATNGTGFYTQGDTTPQGFQGNQVFFGDVINNTSNGIVIDGNVSGGHNSGNNRFYVGVSEHNGGAGIIDNNGQNIWEVCNTNSNTNGGFVLGSTVTLVPLVRGFFSDGINPNNGVVSVNGVYGKSAPTGASVGTVETLIMSFAIPAGHAHLGMALVAKCIGVVSATSNVIFNLRVGTTGTLTDAVAVTTPINSAGSAGGNSFSAFEGQVTVTNLSQTLANISATGHNFSGLGNSYATGTVTGLSIASALFVTLSASGSTGTLTINSANISVVS